MKKYIYASGIAILSQIQTNLADAASDGWILWDFGGSETENKIRTGDIHTEDIPNIIVGATDFFMWIAGTISIIFIIIWAYKILFWSLSQDKTKWRDTIIMALVGFAIASLAWVIIKFLLNNLG